MNSNGSSINLNLSLSPPQLMQLDESINQDGDFDMALLNNSFINQVLSTSKSPQPTTSQPHISSSQSSSTTDSQTVLPASSQLPISSSQSSLASSQPTSSKNQYEWKPLSIFTEYQQVNDFLESNKYRHICTHGKQARTCNAHENLDGHQMLLSTYKCQSSWCKRLVDEDTCQHQYQVRHCLTDQKIFFYQYQQHSNKYVEAEPLVERTYDFNSYYKMNSLNISKSNGLKDLFHIGKSSILHLVTRRPVTRSRVSMQELKLRLPIVINCRL
jgi:hypothetical protein